MDRQKLKDRLESIGYTILIVVALLALVTYPFTPNAFATHTTQLWFGDNNATGSAAHVWDGGNDLLGDQYTTPGVNITVQSMSLYLVCANAHSVKLAIYKGGDLSFIDETEERSVTSGSGAWFTFMFASPVSLNASSNYLLCVWFNDGTGTFSTYYDALSTTWRDNENYNGFPATYVKDDTFASEQIQIYATYTVDYVYTLHGLYDENTGLRDGSVDVTAHFTSIGPEDFTVNGEYNFYHDTMPLYFSYNTTESWRHEYWLQDGENNTNIYLWNSTDYNVYTITFYDLAGILDSESIIEAERYVNATLYTIEKRRVDVQKKVVMSLVEEELYTLTVVDAIGEGQYIYGDLRLTAVTSISLTLKGIEFPKETLLTYSNVRIYGYRDHDTPTGNITLIYADALEQTLNVTLTIAYVNGTVLYSNSGVMQSFIYTWTSANNATDYLASIIVDHARYGVFTWRQIFSRESFSGMPFGLAFLGSLPFDTAYLLPTLLIVLCAGCFSVLSVEAGAFMTVVVAFVMAYMGWLPIPGATLIVAMILAVLLGITLAKRRLIVG